MDSATPESPLQVKVTMQHGETEEATSPPSTSAKEDSEEVQRHLQLVGTQTNSTTSQSRLLSEVLNAPLFSLAIKRALEAHNSHNIADNSVLRSSYAQYGLLGARKTTYLGVGDAKEEDPNSDQLVYANMEVPWSTFICGSQGSGKSHTLSCLLENALVKPSTVGKLPNPLAGMVFHYDTFASAEVTQPCEAAYLCSTGMPVRVLVSSSNYAAMYKHYHNLPNLPRDCPRPEVIRLMFSDKQLNVSIVKTLMAFDSESRQPLYMAVLDRILRQMATERAGLPGFDYTEFKRRLRRERFSEGQEMMLQLRLDLLDSFLDLENKHIQYGKFEPGTLTVVDLSCPFVDAGAACALFSICLSLFLSRRGDSGRIIALDEAHKFLTQAAQASQLTDQLNSIIRQQRHLATRVIIATQEPTLSPTLIDLSDVSIVHRFRSPAWFEALKSHLAGLSKRAGTNTHDLDSVLQTIYGLETGEALVFGPTSIMDVPDGAGSLASVKLMRDTFAKLKIRQRVTADGGKSIVASDKNGGPISTQDEPSIVSLVKTLQQLPTNDRQNMKASEEIDESDSDDEDYEDDSEDDDYDDSLSDPPIAPSSSRPGAELPGRATVPSHLAPLPIHGNMSAFSKMSLLTAITPQPVPVVVSKKRIMSELRGSVKQSLNDRGIDNLDFGVVRRATEIRLHLDLGHLHTQHLKVLTGKVIKDTCDEYFRKHGVHPRPKWANWK